MKQSLIKFPNNVRLVLAPRKTKVVSVSVSIGAGSELENSRVSGIGHFIESLMCRELKKSVVKFGGVCEARSGFEHIELSVCTSKEHLKDAIIALSNSIFDFAPKYNSVEEERHKILLECEKSQYNPTALLNELTIKQLYKGSALKSNIIGTEKTISEISLKDIMEHYHKIMIPNAIVFSIVGDISDSDFTENNEENEYKTKESKISYLANKDDEIIINPKKNIYDLLRELSDEEEDDDETDLDTDVDGIDDDIYEFSNKQKSEEKSSDLLKFDLDLQVGDKTYNKDNKKTKNSLNNAKANDEEKNIRNKSASSVFVKRSVDKPLPNWNAAQFDTVVTSNSVQNSQSDQDTYNDIHYLVVKYFYGRTLELKQGKVKTTPYIKSKGKSYVAKTKSLNQSRFQISFPSSPYSANSYKYSKMLEIYLGRYLSVELSKLRKIYNLNVKAYAYKNNAHISINFAVDDEDAIDVYYKVYEFLKKIKYERLTFSEFESLKNLYATDVALKHETALSLARRLNKWLYMKNVVFDIDQEIEIIKALDYKNFLTVINQILDFDAMCVVYVGKKKVNFDPFID